MQLPQPQFIQPFVQQVQGGFLNKKAAEIRCFLFILLRAEDTVARIAQAGVEVDMIVESPINGSQV